MQPSVALHVYLLIVDDTETHFGGFLRKTKRISNEKEEDDKGLKKTRKQVIEELITKSKLHKVCMLSVNSSSISLSVCLSIFVHLSICSSIYLSFAHLSVICSFIYLHIYLSFVHLTVA